MYAIHRFVAMESGIFVCMAIDRHVAICRPLHYPSIITGLFVVKATVFMALRNSLTTIPIPVFAAQRQYCSKNQIEHCLCSNLESLAYLVMRWQHSQEHLPATSGLDTHGKWFGFDYFIYMHWYFQSVLKLELSRSCIQGLKYLHFPPHPNSFLLHSHYCHFHHPQCSNDSSPHPSSTNVLHNVIPLPSILMVYALKNKELRQGLYKALKLYFKGN